MSSVNRADLKKIVKIHLTNAMKIVFHGQPENLAKNLITMFDERNLTQNGICFT